MALKTRIIAATTTPTFLASSTVPAGSTVAISLAGAHIQDVVPVVVWNPSTQAVYLGGSSMSTASSAIGLPLVGPNYITYNLLGSEPLVACTTNASISLTVQGGRQSG